MKLEGSWVDKSLGSVVFEERSGAGTVVFVESVLFSTESGTVEGFATRLSAAVGGASPGCGAGEGACIS
jgi:hypothetical protein